jgi:NADH-quinone oxidoreductase subunit M
VLGVILGAVYLTWMYQRVIFGPITHEENRSLPDLSLREIVVFAPIVLLVFWMGIYPKPLLARMEPSIHAIVARVEKGARRSVGTERGAPITEAKAPGPAAAKAL